MGNHIFISYIIPCYNLENCVERCLDSLSRQSLETDEDIEFIIVNDGSKDGTLGILERFVSSEKRAVLIDQENQGVSSARNAGLRQAKGEYVFFLDGDDILEDDASRIIYEQCRKNKPDILVTNAYLVGEKFDWRWGWNVCEGLASGNYDVEQFTRNTDKLPISFKTYRREFLLQNNLSYDLDLKVGEVYAFFFHALAFADHITFTEERIMNYVVRQGSTMRQWDIARDGLILKTIDRIDEYSQLFKFDIRHTLSYNAAFFEIVDLFGATKYLKTYPYTPQIGTSLKQIKQKKAFNAVLTYFLRHSKKVDNRFIVCFVFSLFPVKFAYKLLRGGLRLKHIKNNR